MTREEATIQALMGHIGALEDTIKRQSETIKALEQEPTYYPPCIDCNKKMDEIRRAYDKLKEYKRLIDADELLKRIAEKCKTPSLSADTVNGLCGATAIIYDMLNESEVDNADSN